jgi:hypothetical protein
MVCGEKTTATDDDMSPMCEDCTSWWPVVEGVGAIMRGELVLPEEGDGDAAEDEDE